MQKTLLNLIEKIKGYNEKIDFLKTEIKEVQDGLTKSCFNMDKLFTQKDLTNFIRNLTEPETKILINSLKIKLTELKKASRNQIQK